MWCKQFRDYDPNNRIVQTVLDHNLQAELADYDNRASLCEKNELLTNCISSSIKIIGQIYNYVQLLFSKCKFYINFKCFYINLFNFKLALLKSNFLVVFNQFMHRIDALERCLQGKILENLFLFNNF